MSPAQKAIRVLLITVMALTVVAFGLVIGGKGGWILPGMKAEDARSVWDDANYRSRNSGETQPGPVGALTEFPVPDDVPSKSVAGFQNGKGMGVLYTTSKSPKELVEFLRSKLGVIGWREVPVDLKKASQEAPNLTWGPADSKDAVPVFPRKHEDSRELPDPATGATEPEPEESMHVFAGETQVLYVRLSASKAGTDCSLLMMNR